MSRFQLLSDAQWSLIEGLLPRPTGRKGRLFSDWSLSVDSTIAGAHQHATNTKRLTGAGSHYTIPGVEPLDHAVGRTRGGLSTKIHQLVDGLATRYDKLAIVYRAAVILNAVVAWAKLLSEPR